MGDLIVNVEVASCYIHLIEDVELVTDLLQQSIFTSYYWNLLARVALLMRTVPWWNTQLRSLRLQKRRLFNRNKRTGEWDTYKKALTHYNTEIRKAKRSSSRRYC
jgi:hypothetical protein